MLTDKIKLKYGLLPQEDACWQIGNTAATAKFITHSGDDYYNTLL
jgi:hypothetical protein